VPNTNPQAIAVANGKIRVAADRMGQLYNFYKALQAEGTAEGWLTLFPADAEVRDFIADVTAFITWIEANGNLIRNRALKIAVNPERY
jgi:hypothetical protein